MSQNRAADIPATHTLGAPERTGPTGPRQRGCNRHWVIKTLPPQTVTLAKENISLFYFLQSLAPGKHFIPLSEARVPSLPGSLP